MKKKNTETQIDMILLSRFFCRPSQSHFGHDIYNKQNNVTLFTQMCFCFDRITNLQGI